MGKYINTEFNKYRDINESEHQYYEYTLEQITILDRLEKVFNDTFPTTNRYSGGRYFLFSKAIKFGEIDEFDAVCTHFHYNESDRDIFFNIAYNNHIDTDTSIPNYIVNNTTSITLNDINNKYTDTSDYIDGTFVPKRKVLIVDSDFISNILLAAQDTKNIRLSKYMKALYDVNRENKLIKDRTRREHELRLEYDYKHHLYFYNIDQEYHKEKWMEVKNMSDEEYNTTYLDRINKSNKIAMDILDKIIKDEKSKK